VPRHLCFVIVCGGVESQLFNKSIFLKGTMNPRGKQ
jgi:hypothetical protein